MAILPVARQLLLCDHYVRYENSKCDLYSIFSAVAPPAGYPYESKPFYVFAQLVNGLGRMSFRVQVRRAATDEVVFASDQKQLVFPDRHKIAPLVFLFEEFQFSHAGVYLFELYCDNNWVCDTTLELR